MGRTGADELNCSISAPTGTDESASPRATIINESLAAARAGCEVAVGELYEAVYTELHRLARSQRMRWSGNNTMDTTGLLHESFVKLVDRDRLECADLGHFFAVAAKAMRHILIDYAKKQRSAKRGGRRRRVELTETHAAPATGADTIVALATGLERLRCIDARRAAVFEHRFLLGLTVAETAETLDISPATVKRDWTLAACFLRDQMEAG